jgi:hypothetical protein
MKPRMGECMVRTFVTDTLKIQLPRLYHQSFIHNNCGGACILAGLSQWNAVRIHFPERFAEAEAREAAFHSKTGFSVCRDQSGGTVKPYTLQQLRVDAEQGRKFGDSWKSQCACLEQARLFSDDDCFTEGLNDDDSEAD